MKKSKEEIAKRAFLKYLERGGQHGDDQKDWFEAEKEIKGKTETKTKAKSIKSRKKK